MRQEEDMTHRLEGKVKSRADAGFTQLSDKASNWILKMGTRPEQTFLRRPIRSATQNRSRSQVAEDVNETHSGTHTISHLLGMKQQVAEKKEEPL